jgi:uncharacterized protein YndB with AHSA1/START domain
MTERWLLLPSPFLGPVAYEPLAESLASQGDSAMVAVLPPAPFGAEDVLAAFVDQAARLPATVLVPHSNAGFYAPAVRAATPGVTATVYVDAALPEAHARRTPLAPPAFADTVAAMADDAGLLPPWTSWWETAELEPLFPSPEWLARVDREAPRLPAAYVRSFLPVPARWIDAPSGYLAFGDTYAAELAAARAAGWPTAAMDGHHLTLLSDPSGVAERVRDLRKKCATAGLQYRGQRATVGLHTNRFRERISTMQVKDTIEQQIDIAAPIDRVWALVSQPGWFINDGAITDHALEERDGQVVVSDPTHGDFAFEPIESREPEYVATRWFPREGQEGTRVTTVVEFWLEETAAGVRLKVRESGFTGGSLSDAARGTHFAENTEGWAAELGAARSHLEAA